MRPHEKLNAFHVGGSTSSWGSSNSRSSSWVSLFMVVSWILGASVSTGSSAGFFLDLF